MLGLVFAKEPPASPMKTRGITNMFFRIPPQANNHRVAASWSMRTDITLYGLTPHMHLRGKAFQLEVAYPDGRTQTLLSVLNYSFSWQTSYKLQTPIRIPHDSKIMARGYFDNSAKNKSNPDPTKSVRFGEPTYDEMMMAFVDYVAERPSDPVKLDPQVFAKLEGRYDFGNKQTYRVTREGDRYFGQVIDPGGPGVKRELFAVSDLKFILPDIEAQLVFIKDADGAVNQVVYQATDYSIKGKRL